MATCPKDGSSIDVDYGMATCPTCGVILFVDMDGEAMIGSQVPAQAPAEVGSNPEAPYIHSPFEVEAIEPEVTRVAQAAPASPILDQDPESDPLAALHPLVSPYELMSATTDGGPSAASVPESLLSETIEFPSNESPATVESASEVLSSSGDEMSMEQFLGYESTEDNALPEPALAPIEEIGGPGDPLGIADYANSEFSQAKDGPFLFRVVISGIDSKELRESLREALDDARFGWNTDELIHAISKGEMHIRNVSPVKATILINRIKRLSVRVRWEQYPVTQAEPD